ncbi:hypothetical protein LVJ94_35215 [Pendulispora rubella]|uniref:Uncharacterized protein n=1 Tax=Pendulispora rubella TaxID=2741070 RepID=A0ABZ2KTZ4_9BACT
MDLFIETSFEKSSSAEVALSEDPNAWPSEVLQQLFKAMPFVADFEPHVQLDPVDGERGYGFGAIQVTNKTEMQLGTPEEAMQEAGVRSAKIPIVIRDRMLQPLDLLVTDNSEMLPLTEARLRQAIFRPQIFDITGTTPGDMSMIGQLYPPYRQNYGFGGGGATMSAGPMGKEGRLVSSSSPELLTAIAPTIERAHYDEWKTALAEKGLQAAFVKNAHARPAVAMLLDSEPMEGRYKMAEAILGQVKPDVAQLVRMGEGEYLVKSASARLWMVRQERMSRPEALRVFGQKTVLAADISGSATLTADGADGADDEEDHLEDTPALVSEFGIYRVEDLRGRSLVGYVFPALLDTDGTSLPISLFTDGSEAAVQGEIFGVRVEGGASLFEGEPRGHGAFFRTFPDGHGEATLPLTLEASLGSGQGVSYLGKTFTEREIDVQITPDVAHVTEAGGAMLIPSDMQWLSLDETSPVILASARTKTAEAKAFLDSVTIRAGGEGSFSFQGAPLRKLGAEACSFLETDDALFLLGALGVPSEVAARKLAEATTGARPVTVGVRRTIEPIGKAGEQAKKLAGERLQQLPNLRRSLVKEAGEIPDPVAVDTVLALGFLNPENIRTFIEYLPRIDNAQKKMCELLLAARLGLRDVPVAAIERAIRTTEEVIEGLRIIAFQTSS